jgi:hypothetical protein
VTEITSGFHGGTADGFQGLLLSYGGGKSR